jgi:hypothetical protein
MKNDSIAYLTQEPLSGPTWQHIRQEIISDLCQIIDGMPVTEYVVAMVQWRGRQLAGIVYEPCPIQIVGPSGVARGVSVIPSPEKVADHWFPVELPVFPARNGVRLTDDMPVFYFTHVRGNGGNGLVIAARHDKTGRIQWSGNEAIIDEVAVMLAAAGVITIEPRRGFD